MGLGDGGDLSCTTASRDRVGQDSDTSRSVPGNFGIGNIARPGRAVARRGRPLTLNAGPVTAEVRASFGCSCAEPADDGPVAGQLDDEARRDVLDADRDL